MFFYADYTHENRFSCPYCVYAFAQLPSFSYVAFLSFTITRLFSSLLSTRMDMVKDENTSVKKVPIKIVHSESDTEKENRQYLDLPIETPVSSQGPGATHLQSLGNLDQSYSLFCTYTRQKDQGSDPREADMGPLKDQGPQTNMNPVSYALHGLQTTPSSDQSSNGVSSNPLQSEDDEKRKELARDIMDKDKSLVDILDQSKMKTTMDLMEGIFPQGEQLLEESQQRRKAAPKLLSPRNSVEKSVFLYSYFLSLKKMFIFLF